MFEQGVSEQSGVFKAGNYFCQIVGTLTRGAMGLQGGTWPEPSPVAGTTSGGMFWLE